MQRTHIKLAVKADRGKLAFSDVLAHQRLNRVIAVHHPVGIEEIGDAEDDGGKEQRQEDSGVPGHPAWDYYLSFPNLEGCTKSGEEKKRDKGKEIADVEIFQRRKIVFKP